MAKWVPCGKCEVCTMPELAWSDCGQPTKIEATLYILSVDVYGPYDEVPDTTILAAIPCVDKAAQVASNYEVNKGMEHHARDTWFEFGITEIGPDGLVIDSYRVENNGGVLFRMSA